ncbi:MAG: hypothetical protein C5B50_30590 [Verrucomicrobia bacterium]|nr:MAG: hypothetical protein C5B50_30590 [Verrucomicrobiota bacterium]
MSRLILCPLFVACFMFAGCRSSSPAGGAPITTSAEAISFCLGPIDPPRPTYIGHIVRTNSLDPTQRVRVLVLGCVNQPGWVTVPKGSTVLGAIKIAGGFERRGASWYVQVVRGSKTYLYELTTGALSRKSRDEYLIWYGPCQWSIRSGSYVVDKRSRSDVVLEDEDKVLVPSVL